MRCTPASRMLAGPVALPSTPGGRVWPVSARCSARRSPGSAGTLPPSPRLIRRPVEREAPLADRLDYAVAWLPSWVWRPAQGGQYEPANVSDLDRFHVGRCGRCGARIDDRA